MEIWVINEPSTVEYHEGWESITEKTAAAAAEICHIDEKCEVSIFLTDNQYIQELNQLYRGKNYPTDVLSFAMQEKGEGEPDFDFPEDANIIGDIVISVEKAKEQSVEYGHSLERELAFLTVHGFLHLLGYDHEEERDQLVMREMEERILKTLQLGR